MLANSINTKYKVTLYKIEHCLLVIHIFRCCKSSTGIEDILGEVSLKRVILFLFSDTSPNTSSIPIIMYQLEVSETKTSSTVARKIL